MPLPSKDIMYEMAVCHLRHFGDNATKLRQLALIQSYTVIAGAVYLITEEYYMFAAIAGLFGGIMMGILYAIHSNFLIYYKDIQIYISRLETDVEFAGGLIENVESKRNLRVSGLFGFFATNGVFVIVSLIMIAILVYGFIQWYIA